MEQELASIIKYTLDNAGNPSPYYHSIPRNFIVPAAFFPEPKISTGGETFATYRAQYDLVISFYHKSSRQAYELGLKALTAIKAARNLIPLIDANGKLTGGGIRLGDPSLEGYDTGIAKLTLNWISRRSYNAEAVSKMQSFGVEYWGKPELYEQKDIPDDVAESFIPLSEEFA